MSFPDVPTIDAEEAYRRGWECGRNGPDMFNSHFSIFAKKENTKAWERGKKDAYPLRDQLTLMVLPILSIMQIF